MTLSLAIGLASKALKPHHRHLGRRSDALRGGFRTTNQPEPRPFWSCDEPQALIGHLAARDGRGALGPTISKTRGPASRHHRHLRAWMFQRTRNAIANLRAPLRLLREPRGFYHRPPSAPFAMRVEALATASAIKPGPWVHCEPVGHISHLGGIGCWGASGHHRPNSALWSCRTTRPDMGTVGCLRMCGSLGHQRSAHHLAKQAPLGSGGGSPMATTRHLALAMDVRASLRKQCQPILGLWLAREASSTIVHLGAPFGCAVTFRHRRQPRPLRRSRRQPLGQPSAAPGALGFPSRSEHPQATIQHSVLGMCRETLGATARPKMSALHRVRRIGAPSGYLGGSDVPASPRASHGHLDGPRMCGGPQNTIANLRCLRCYGSLKHTGHLLAALDVRAKEKVPPHFRDSRLFHLGRRDSPSERLIGLPTIRKLALKNKIVFGTGDYWRSSTLTANMAFVRAVAQTGMSLFTIKHSPRALTGN
ncbi:hypothetical protein GOBAR_AA16187 [Gossypium barbadense]|uniref:DUF1308 domain-containing protein n=1 Tax=Gossypium barbadense TaxID=3634 RepID=A0A2P5XMC6_GOSBA|nr:hypothetical protein GOBAR_AA16187 [Gossypium barbadense]